MKTSGVPETPEVVTEMFAVPETLDGVPETPEQVPEIRERASGPDINSGVSEGVPEMRERDSGFSVDSWVSVRFPWGNVACGVILDGLVTWNELECDCGVTRDGLVIWDRLVTWNGLLCVCDCRVSLARICWIRGVNRSRVYWNIMPITKQQRKVFILLFFFF
jgi:hypothetical protein